MKDYTVKNIADIVGGRVINSANNDIVVRDLLFDSRLMMSPDNTLFFSLKTHHDSGDKYIRGLYDKGVKLFVIEEKQAVINGIADMSDATFIVVDDTLRALQKLAAFHRGKFNIPVIAISGSNGKTIVKEWLYQIFSSEYSVVRSPKSYNSQIGVPMSVWQLDDIHNMAIFEAGISYPDEMANLKNIIQPTIGIFTNIGQAHGKNFDDISVKVEEKMKLFTDVDVLIYCSDYDDIRKCIAKHSVKTFSWSKIDAKSDFFVTSIQKKENTTCINAIFKSENLSIEIPFTDDASVENAIHCWITALLFNFPQSLIADKMKKLDAVAMRMELKSGINNCDIINDSYNSDFNSLTIALDFMNQQHHNKKRVIIMSDILQSELKEEILYTKIAQLLKNKGVDFLIGIGEAISRQRDKFTVGKMFFKDTETFLKTYPLETFRDKFILLKGARDFGFEKISMLLQEKVHETILEINLDNLVKNMNYYRSKLKKETKLMVMVKAFAYGSGNFEISKVVEFRHADYLTVAYADEGVELRRKGIKLPIMVMTPEMNTFETIIRYNLEPDIYSFRSLSLLEDAIENLNLGSETTIGIHIKLDSGMHRLGFQPQDIDQLIERLSNNRKIVVKSVFSHLAGSDTPDLDDFTMQQINTFDMMSSKILSAFPYKILRHILNSAGISRFPDYQYDMVRLGIGIYGISPCEDDRGKLHPVVSLKTTIVQIKEYEAGETVGYGRRGLLKRKSRIGVVPIGYADGLKRLAGNEKLCFYVNGKAAPIIGNICMDMCMIDLTDIECKENDTAVLLKDESSVEQMANVSDTIPYEILTSISHRVKRVYCQE